MTSGGNLSTTGTITAAGNITANGNIVGDGSTAISSMASLGVGTVAATSTITAGGIHVGGTSDPGTDNLVVDGTATITGQLNQNGSVVFNEAGADRDFRIEGQSGVGGAADKANIFRFDATYGAISIGSAPLNNANGRLFQVNGNSASSYIARFHNDGNSSNRYGVIISAGTDDNTGTNYLLTFHDGDGDGIGFITATGGNVAYGTFTGVHNSYMMASDSTSANVVTNLPTSSLELYYPQGTIVSMVSSSYDGSMQPINYTISSSAHQDKRAYGVYAGSHEWGGDEDANKDLKDKHLISAVGDGYVLVNNQNGDIEIGDYITTASGSGGYGCKQSDDLLHNYTVAKATDGVTWSNESTTYKLLACTYHCG
jgi:hypothetical protein